MAEKYVSDFVKRDRERKRYFVRLYEPKPGQTFTFARHEPHRLFHCDKHGTVRRVKSPRA